MDILLLILLFIGASVLAALVFLAPKNGRFYD